MVRSGNRNGTVKMGNHTRQTIRQTAFKHSSPHTYAARNFLTLSPYPSPRISRKIRPPKSRGVLFSCISINPEKNIGPHAPGYIQDSKWTYGGK